MTIKRHFMLLHLPEMDVMHIADALDIGHRLNHCASIHVGRAAQHQHADRAPDFGKCEVKDVKRDTDGDRGIDPPKVI